MYNPSTLHDDPQPRSMFHNQKDINIWQKNTHSSQKPLHAQQMPNTRTTEPIVTGTSILAIKYKDGVMLAGDTLASYGSLARFRDVERIRKLGNYTVIGGSGEYSDYQHIMKMLDD